MGEPIFGLFGGAAAVDDRTLRHAVVLGPERTLEQDPLFAFRILVDIAIKALSRSDNDRRQPCSSIASLLIRAFQSPSTLSAACTRMA